MDFKKINLSSGIRDLSVTLFSRGGSMLIGLAMQSLLAWKLGPEGRGEYAVCLVFSSLVAVIFSLGMDWATNYYIATKQYSQNCIITFSIICGCVSTIMILLVVPNLVTLNIPFFEKGTPQIWSYATGWSIALLFFTFCSSILAGMREFKALAWLNLYRVLITLILTFSLLQFDNWNVVAPVLSDIISCTVATLVSLSLWIKRFNYHWELPDVTLVYKLIGYGLRFFGGSIGMIANARIGTIILAFVVDKEALGYFALSMSFLAQMITLADVTGRIIQPRVAESSDGRPELVTKCTKIIGILVLSCGGLLLLFAKLWVPILFSISFLPIIPIMLILFPGIWLRVLGKLLFPYFNGINRPEIVTLATGITLATNFLLLFVLIGPYGLYGAALAVTISYGLSTVFVIKNFCKLSKQPMRSLLIPNSSDFKYLSRQLKVI